MKKSFSDLWKVKANTTGDASLRKPKCVNGVETVDFRVQEVSDQYWVTEQCGGYSLPVRETSPQKCPILHIQEQKPGKSKSLLSVSRCIPKGCRKVHWRQTQARPAHCPAKPLTLPSQSPAVARPVSHTLPWGDEPYLRHSGVQTWSKTPGSLSTLRLLPGVTRTSTAFISSGWDSSSTYVFKPFSWLISLDFFLSLSQAVLLCITKEWAGKLQIF